ALGALARGHRKAFSGPVVAITGSNGKTSTKELTYSILSASEPCLKNEGNLNNEFGLPLTLMRRESGHRAAVVEMGMNHRGEIARLVEIAAPNVGVITNVGTAHIEYLGSIEEIALEKGDLIAGLSPGGTAVLNADDARVLAQRERGPERVLTFGRKTPADIRPEQIRFETEGAFVFRLCTPLGDTEVRVRGWAETTVENALAAAAAAVAAGSTLEEIQTGLDGFTAVPGRMQSLKMKTGAHILDDSYNANPQSVRNALETLARVKADGRAIAVLGDMGELGKDASWAHREMGRFTAETGTDLLFVMGEHAEELARAAIESGMPEENVSVCEQHGEIAQAITSLSRAGDWILVKGSRSMKMERVVQNLTSGGAN
ncbi:MAG: UDP-N-acetylmuramoyl-tripeptide--D-alanyl-D-alanine ligase, partial [Myxococcota bacterium]|nr:UDP-N-acetylmuramoyl-tripeptide--D-alanyl-D-alanine ligase [Myxococcota bacterium]